MEPMDQPAAAAAAAAETDPWSGMQVADDGEDIVDEQNASSSVCSSSSSDDQDGDDTGISPDLVNLIKTNEAFYGPLIRGIAEVQIQQGVELDAYVAHDVVRVDINTRLIQQRNFTRDPDENRTKQPTGSKKKDEQGRRIPAEKTIRENIGNRVVESLHRVDEAYWGGSSIQDLLKKLLKELCNHRATSLNLSDIDNDNLPGNLWAVFVPLVEELSPWEKEEVVFLKEELLNDGIGKYVRGGDKGLIAGLIRIVKASRLNKGRGMKAGSCMQDYSLTRIVSDLKMYPPSLIDVHKSWMAMEIVQPSGRAATVAEEELIRAARAVEGISYELLKYILKVGIGRARPGCPDLGQFIANICDGSDNEALGTVVESGGYSRSTNHAVYIVTTRDSLHDYDYLSNRGVRSEGPALRRFERVLNNVHAVVAANGGSTELPRLRHGESLAQFTRKEVWSARAFLAAQRYLWKNYMMHPVKAEIMRKNQIWRIFLGDSGGPKLTDEEVWAEQHAKFKEIKSNCNRPRYRDAPPDSYYDDEDCPDDCESLNHWYYNQLLDTSRGVIRQKYLELMVKVYPQWEAIARRRIRDNVYTAPKSLRQARYEANKEQCGGCGECHEYSEVVFMICFCCKKDHYNNPACIGKTRDECIAMMTGCGEQFWKCTECEEGF